MSRLLESYVAGRWVHRRRTRASPSSTPPPARRSPASPAGASTWPPWSTTPASVGRAGDARADLPPARGRAQGAGQAALGGQGRALRAVPAHRRHPPRLDGRHRRRLRHALRFREQGHPRAAQRHDRARRTARAPGARRHLRRPARLHLASGRRRAGQRLQLPRLGHAREARAGVPRRTADDRQAGQPDGVPHRGRRTPHRRLGPAPRGIAAAAVRQRRHPARPAHRAGLRGVHGLGAHRGRPARAPVRAARRASRSASRRTRSTSRSWVPTSPPTTPSSTSSSRASSPR